MQTTLRAVIATLVATGAAALIALAVAIVLSQNAMVVNGCVIQSAFAEAWLHEPTRCPGVDLHGADLAGVHLQKADLAGAISLPRTFGGRTCVWPSSSTRTSAGRSWTAPT